MELPKLADKVPPALKGLVADKDALQFLRRATQVITDPQETGETFSSF